MCVKNLRAMKIKHGEIESSTIALIYIFIKKKLFIYMYLNVLISGGSMVVIVFLKIIKLKSIGF